ncbi:hypothetical protein LBYZC6_08700 [Lacrimispora brassicae]
MIIVKKKKGEHTGLASEMGAMIPAAVGAMKMKIARNRKAEVWIEFRPSLLHKYPGAGFLWSGYENNTDTISGDGAYAE